MALLCLTQNAFHSIVPYQFYIEKIFQTPVMFLTKNEYNQQSWQVNQ